jgi:uncharacterized protein (UPF0335 family)
MNYSEIINEVEKLSIQQRFFLIEKTIHSIRLEDEKRKMTQAVEEMYAEYKTNKELTAFTNLDFESFYETK